MAWARIRWTRRRKRRRKAGRWKGKRKDGFGVDDKGSEGNKNRKIGGEVGIV